MASRVERLTLVLELAEKAENTAAEGFNLARTQVQHESQKLNDINSYYSEYQQGLSAARGHQNVDAMIRARGFLQQLAQAKQQQQQIVSQYTKLSEQKKQAWLKAHLKHKSMQELIARLKAEEARALSVKEEKMLDEWVTGGFARKSAQNT